MLDHVLQCYSSLNAVIHLHTYLEAVESILNMTMQIKTKSEIKNNNNNNIIPQLHTTTIVTVTTVMITIKQKLKIIFILKIVFTFPMQIYIIHANVKSGHAMFLP